MRIIQITPGTGGEFFCENCIRDHALASALVRGGHDAAVVPLYLPLPTDQWGAGPAEPIFFGGINVYLQQKSALFRRTPRWVDRLFDARGLLNWAARRAGMTRAGDLGAPTLSMLQGPAGRQRKELRRLVDWLATRDRPDVVCLSNLLLAGLAGPIRDALGVPVLCLLEGEDQFLDALPEPYNRRAWELLRRKAGDFAGFLAVSRYFADAMTARLGVPPERVRVVPSGIELEGYQPPPRRPEKPVIGFLSMICHERGADLLLEAFLRLRADERLRDVRLRAAGGWTGRHEPFVAQLRARLRQAGAEGQVELLPNLSRAQKQQFLPQLTVLSVPSRYPEPFGLYVLEAMACGVPVVQPDHGGIPEIVRATGGGLLHRPGDVDSLTETLRQVLLDEPRARALGQAGRKGVMEDFSAERAARRFLQAVQSLTGAEHV